MTAPDPRLVQFRQQLDKIDAQLVDLLAQRFAVTNQVGELKRDQGLPPRDPSRESAQFERFAELAKQHGVDPELTSQIFRLIVDAVVAKHTTLQKGQDD